MKSTGREPDPAFGRLIAHGLAREVDASGNACPDADLLAGWFDHTLSASEGERVETHVAGCECCQQILAALARSEPEVIRAAPLPAPSRAWHWHWRWAVPLATAVLVILIGSHTLRAPGPATSVGAPPPTRLATNQAAPVPLAEPPASGLGTSASGEAGPQPAETKADKPADRLRPSGAGQTSAQPVQVAAGKLAAPPPAGPAAAPIAAPAPVGVAQATKPENLMAEMAQRQSDAASLKTLKTAAPSPAAPAVAGSVAVDNRAAVKVSGLQAVRQVSVVSPTVAGSAIAWRFGQDGAIEKSSDRGQTWERQPSGVTTALSDASAPGERVCWIVGARGVVLRTIDGRTWQRLTKPTDADLVAVHAWNELSAVVTASDRSNYETADGGRSWTRRR